MVFDIIFYRTYNTVGIEYKYFGKGRFHMNTYINAGAFFLATSVVVLIAILIFDIIASYKIWEEIRKGNMAVAMSTGGIVAGVSNIMHFAITSNDSILKTALWGGIGTAALLIVYFVFELLTPKLKVNEEIGKGNRAVGFISMIFSISFSFIIGASIS
jgi:putative membrane protein